MDQKRVIRSAGLVGGMILMSRIFGLVRDSMMAAFFGTSLAMSAFLVAFTVPNLFRSLFGEGALSSAYVPVFTEVMEKRGKAQVWIFAAKMMTLLAIILASISIAGVALVSASLKIPGLSAKAAMIAGLLRVMLPYMFFICMAAFFAAMLNALKRFAVPAAAPVALNIIMIAAMLWVCPLAGQNPLSRLYALSFSVIFAGILQMAMQLPMLLRAGFRPKLMFDFSDPGVRRVGGLMAAASVGVGVTQFNVLLDRFVAVMVGEGAPSYLYFAERLIYLPLGVFATAAGTVLLPAFSGFAAQSRFDLINETLRRSARHIVFIMAPCAAGLMALAGPIIRLLYERGEFTGLSTANTALALQVYAPGLVLFGLYKVIVPAFYSMQDVRTPVKVGIICTTLNAALKFAFIYPFGYIGIIAATLVTSALNTAILAWLLGRRSGVARWGDVAQAAARMAAAAAVMAVAAVAVHGAAESFLAPRALPGFLRNLLAIAAAVAAAVPVYLLGCAALRCPEAGELLAAFRRRPPARK